VIVRVGGQNSISPDLSQNCPTKFQRRQSMNNPKDVKRIRRPEKMPCLVVILMWHAN
jgi:hypothetical protein